MIAIKNKNLHQDATVGQMAFAPVELTRSAVKTTIAYFSHDQEALIDGMGKVASSFDLLISGASAILRGIISLGVYLGDDFIKALSPVYKKILLPYAIFGLVLSFFELLYESINIFHGCSLRSHLKFSNEGEHFEGENFKNNQTLIRNEYFTISDQEKADIEKDVTRKFPNPDDVDFKDHERANLETKLLTLKFESLCRRVSEPAAIEISKIINSDDAADCRLLTEILDIQTKKMLITHAVSLLSIILSTLCYALLLASFPYSVPVILSLAAASIFFFIIYYALDKGFFNQTGYTFSLRACIPNCIRRIFSPDIAGREVPHPLSSREIQLMDMPSRVDQDHR